MLTYPNQQTVSTRALAWGVAGENLVDEPGMSAEEALRRGGLADWNVRHMPLATSLPEDAGIESFDDAGLVMPDHRAVIATIDGRRHALGVVGNQHHAFQNEEQVALVQNVMDEGGANVVAAGSIKSFRKAFVVTKMPEGILIGGQDASDLYLGSMNSHDGSGALRLFVTANRLACTNMLDSTIKGATSKWSVRHTSGLRGRIEQARRALDLTFAWAQEFQAAGDRMLATPMSASEFDVIVDRLMPASTATQAGWRQRAEDKRSSLRFLFHEAPTNEMGRGTRWAAYNAFTEFADWINPVSGADPDGVKRATRNLDPAEDNIKQRAFDLLAV